MVCGALIRSGGEVLLRGIGGMSACRCAKAVSF